MSHSPSRAARACMIASPLGLITVKSTAWAGESSTSCCSFVMRGIFVAGRNAHSWAAVHSSELATDVCETLAS